MISPGSITNSVPDPDEFVRNIRDVQRNAQEMASARSGERMQIGAGGILINGGGSLTIQGTGALNVGTGALNSAGSITAGTTITAGGKVTGVGVDAGTGQLTGSSVAVTGAGTFATVSTTGVVTIGGDINLAGDLYSPHGKATPVVSGYVVAYFNGPDGRLGASPPSAVVNKQDVTPPNAAELVQALLRVSLVRFKYIANVDALGDAAPDELGGIAEYFDTTALGEYVYRDDNNVPLGINYERLSIPLIAVVQSLDARLKILEGKLVAAGL